MAEVRDLDLSLHEHAAFLRAVARRLINDPSTVDDLVQETFVRALTSRPARVQSVRAWLATVVRNVFRDHRSAELARAGRETAAARVQHGGSDHDDPFGVEVLSRALQALPPDYRRALQLRYYAQLPVNEIAAELGVPVATVKTRLHRGLELLRADVSNRMGGSDRMRRALAPLAGVPLIPGVVASAAGVIMMKKFVVGAAALAAVMVGVFVVPENGGANVDAGTPRVGARAGVAVAVVPPSPGTAAVQSPDVRAPTERETAVVARPAAPVRGRIVYAATGEPVPFGELSVRGSGAREDLVADRDGMFATTRAFHAGAQMRAEGLGEVAAEVAATPVLDAARSSGRTAPESPPSAEAEPGTSWHPVERFGAPDDVRVAVNPGPTYFVATTIPAACSLVDVAAGLSRRDTTDVAWVRDHTEWNTALRAAPDAPGTFWCRFSEAPGIEQQETGALHLYTANGSWRGTAAVLRMSGLQLEPVVIDMLAAGVVHGTVRNHDGSPRRKKLVTLVRTNDVTIDRTSACTDDEGRYRITLALPGAARLDVTGEDVEPCREKVEVIAGAEVEKNLTVVARRIGGTITGTITTSSGAPFSCNVILTSRDDASIWRTAHIDWHDPGPDGRCSATWAFANVPLVECDVSLGTFEPCGVATRSHRVVAPAERLAFHIDDRLPRQTVELAVEIAGVAVAGSWAIELRGEPGWRVQVGANEPRVEVPVGQPFSWSLAGDGVRARRGSAIAGAGSPLRIAIATDAGFSCCLSCMDIANYYAPRGVEVFADGTSLGVTDADGDLPIDLPRRPRTIALDPRTWRIYRDSGHHPDVDGATGEFAFDEGVAAVLHLYVEKVW